MMVKNFKKKVDPLIDTIKAKLKIFKKKADPVMFYFFLFFSIITIIFYAIWRFDDPSWLNGFDTIGGPVVLGILLVYGILTAFTEKTKTKVREQDIVSNTICGSIDAIVFTSFIYILGGLCLAIILQMAESTIFLLIIEWINHLLFPIILIVGLILIIYYNNSYLGAKIRLLAKNIYIYFIGTIITILFTLSIWVFIYGSILSFAGSKSNNKNEWASILFIVLSSIIILILSYFTFDSGGKIEIMVLRMINELQGPINRFCTNLDINENKVVVKLNETDKKELTGKSFEWSELSKNIVNFFESMFGKNETIH